MRPSSPALPLSEAQRAVLETLARSTAAQHREVLTARALLLAATGMANTAIGKSVGVSPTTVSAWRQRFAEDGLAGLGAVRPGRGRKPTISDDKVAEIVRATVQDTPEGETHWSCRSMAKAQGVKPRHGATDLVGPGAQTPSGGDVQAVQRSYLRGETHRRGRALPRPARQGGGAVPGREVQIQALDRSQPSLPLKKGRAGTMTHDYKRNGTTTLFAALDVATGTVIGQC